LCARAAAHEDIGVIDLSSLGTAICGGEMVWPDTLDRFAMAFAPVGFRRNAFAPSYGLAEATLLVSSGKRRAGPLVLSGPIAEFGPNGETRAVDVTSVSQGAPVVGTTVRIVGTDGAELPERTIGEIEISGDNVGRSTGTEATGAQAAD